MNSLTYSWLSNCALGPFIATFCVWILFMINVYRHEWRNVDLFSVVIVIQEILCSLVVFAYSIINLIRARNETACNIVIWGLIAFRIFQISTICSLAIDRALIIKWPYKYRFSVRHNQIVYHIVVLALMSALVGSAGIFARHSAIDISLKLNSNATFIRMPFCTLNPKSWDIRFNIFFTCISALLTLITLVSFIYIELNRNSDDQIKSKAMPNSQISLYGNLAMDTCGSTEAITKYSNGSYQSLQKFQSISKEEATNRKVLLNHLRTSDLRWSVVVSTTSLSYAINHGPFLIFMFVGILLPQFWTPLHDNVLTWFILAEGFFLPFSLYLTHDSFRDAIRVSLKRTSRNKYPASPGPIKKTPFSLNYNDFVMIDKPYLGLLRNDSKINTSTLNLVSNGRRNQESIQRSDLKVINGLDFQSNELKNAYFPYTRKPFANRNSNPVSYIFSPHVNHVPHAYDLKNNTLLSNLAKSDDSINKEKIALISKDAINLSNWHFMPSEKRYSDNINKYANNRRTMEEEHIYDTLKIGTYVNSPSLSPKYSQKIKSKSRIKIDQTENKIVQNVVNNLDNRSISGLSFTTNANDDFEFHDTRNPASLKREKSQRINVHSDEETSSSDDSPLISTESCTSETDSLEFPSGQFSNSTLVINNLITEQALSNNRDLKAKLIAAKIKSNGDKRKGWQFFSASDLHLLDDQSHESTCSKIQPIVSHSKFINCKKSEFSTNQRSKSETNLATISNQMFLDKHSQNHLHRHNKLKSSKTSNHPYSHPHHNNHNHNHNHHHHHHHHHLSRQPVSALDNQSVVSASSRSTNKSSFYSPIPSLMKSKSKIERISSFSKNKSRIRAARYQVHRRGGRKQDHIALDIDYRKQAPGSRFSLPAEPVGNDFNSHHVIGSLPDLSINPLPLYNPSAH